MTAERTMGLSAKRVLISAGLSTAVTTKAALGNGIAVSQRVDTTSLALTQMPQQITEDTDQDRAASMLLSTRNPTPLKTATHSQRKGSMQIRTRSATQAKSRVLGFSLVLSFLCPLSSTAGRSMRAHLPLNTMALE
jgi:hypothetical protein